MFFCEWQTWSLYYFTAVCVKLKFVVCIEYMFLKLLKNELISISTAAYSKFSRRCTAVIDQKIFFKDLCYNKTTMFPLKLFKVKNVCLARLRDIFRANSLYVRKPQNRKNSRWSKFLKLAFSDLHVVIESNPKKINHCCSILISLLLTFIEVFILNTTSNYLYNGFVLRYLSRFNMSSQ